VARRSGLGRGLSALIPDGPLPEASDGELVPDTHLILVDVGEVHENRFQPRTVFDDDALASLTASVAALGVLQPILVRHREAGGYELIAGERRWRAARAAGLSVVPAVVRVTDDDAALEQALVENLHREDLSPIEEAHGYQQLIDDFGFTQDQVAQRVGKSRPAIANTLRLLQLSTAVQAELAAKRLTAGHARALLACELVDDQEALAARVVHDELSVRQTEEAVRRLIAARYDAEHAGDADSTPVAPGTTRPASILELEQVLSDHFDTKVHIVMGRRGRIIIDFATVEDLERIYQVITHGEQRVDQTGEQHDS